VGIATRYGPARGVAFTTHPSSAEVKERVAIPVLPLQTLNACCKVKYIFLTFFLIVYLFGDRVVWSV